MAISRVDLLWADEGDTPRCPASQRPDARMAPGLVDEDKIPNVEAAPLTDEFLASFPHVGAVSLRGYRRLFLFVNPKLCIARRIVDR